MNIDQDFIEWCAQKFTAGLDTSNDRLLSTLIKHAELFSRTLTAMMETFASEYPKHIKLPADKHQIAQQVLHYLGVPLLDTKTKAA
ncbi:hypothetical protein KC851_03870 [Candidatus Kaiserbacteria bacterium]|nr:hypothetical protein [Candidatus Kaiserbacteria bacterium]